VTIRWGVGIRQTGNYVSFFFNILSLSHANVSGTALDRRVYLNTTLSIQVIAPKLQERTLYQSMELIDGIIKRDGNKQAKL